MISYSTSQMCPNELFPEKRVFRQSRSNSNQGRSADLALNDNKFKVESTACVIHDYEGQRQFIRKEVTKINKLLKFNLYRFNEIVSKTRNRPSEKPIGWREKSTIRKRSRVRERFFYAVYEGKH